MSTIDRFFDNGNHDRPISAQSSELPLGGDRVWRHVPSTLSGGDDDITGIITPEAREAILRRVRDERRPVLGPDYVADLQREAVHPVDMMPEAERPLNRVQHRAAPYEDRTQYHRVDATSLMRNNRPPELPVTGERYGHEPDELGNEIFQESLNAERRPAVERSRLPAMLRNRFAGSLALGVVLAMPTYSYVKQGELLTNPVELIQEVPHDMAANYDYWIAKDGWRKPGKFMGVVTSRLLANDMPEKDRQDKDEANGKRAQ